MLKRMISLIMCAVMVTGMVPVQVFATNDMVEVTSEEILETGHIGEITVPTAGNTIPTETIVETTVRTEEIIDYVVISTELLGETAVPADEILEPTDVSTETQDTTDLEVTTEPQQTESDCTGLSDCAAQIHNDGCEKKLADEKMFADQAAADGVMVLIAELPTLEELQEKPMAEQSEIYEQVQAIYGQYCTLSADQQALLPSVEAVFKPYFDYFNSLVSTIWNGSGTSSSPFQISTEKELRDLAQQVASGKTYSNVYFKLTSNITLTSDWTPIGTEAYKFCGTFDGNGKTISGMTATGDYIGLFAYLGSGAVVKNLTLTDISMNGVYYVAGIAAYVDAGSGSVSISDCHVSGRVYAEDEDEDGDEFGEYAGGIAAYVNATEGTVIIQNCSKSGVSSGDTHVGGIVGYGKSSGRKLTIKNCINHGSIPTGSNSNACGGIAGSLVSAEVESCFNYGTVSGNAYSEDNGSSWLGGITGSGSSVIFTGCGNYGDISTFFAGGISPAQYGGHMVDSCLNVGDLSHSSDGYGSALIYSGSAVNSFYLSGTGSGITGAKSVTSAQLASGEVAHALRDYFGQTIGVDSYPVPLDDSNRVYKVTIMGEASGSYYVNYGKTVALPELSECTAYFDGDSKFDISTPITRDYALAAKGYHKFVDGVCTYCGADGIDYVDVGTCGNSVAWTLNANGVLKISGTGSMTNYSASSPAPWSAYSANIQSIEIGDGVTGVGDYAFKGLTNVTAITVADTVTGIGKYAFNGMTKLASVTIGDSVTSIGDYAFGSCTSLTSLSLGKQLETIGNYTFYQCASLDSVSIPGNVTSLGNSVFQGCSALDYIWMGSAQSLKNIGSYAFAGTAITDQSIPEAVTNIGDYAFANCSALWRVTFGGTAAPAIATTAFSGITAVCHVPEYDSGWASIVNKNYGGTLTWAIGSGTSWDGLSWSLDFDGTLTIFGSGEMGDYSVSYGEGTAPWGSLSEQIYSVVIADGVTSIGNYAFYKCSNLRSVSIADSVKSIGTVYKYSGFSCAFLDCTSLTQITIPQNVTSIGYDDFNGCTSLTAIEVAYGNTAYSSDDGVLYDRYKDTLYCYPAGKTGAFTIPSSVDNIAPYAFSKCTALQEITIPAAVTSIGRAAFGSCKNLSQITFEGSAPTIESAAFSSVTATVDYPYTDTTWTADMLQNYGGTLTWNSGTGSCGTGVQWNLYYQNNYGVLTVSGTGAMDDYTTDTLPWKDYVSSIRTLEVCDGVTHVGAYTLCPGTSSTATSALTTVKLADSVTSIGEYAFSWCSSLWNMTWSNGLQTIGDSAFNHTGLTTITFPDSLRSTGRFSFQSCTSLKSLTFGSGMQTIGYTSFASCTALETVNLGSSVTTLEQSAFNGCSKLTKMVIPASVTSVGTYAFRNCTNFQYVEFLGNAPTINTNAFAGTTCHAYYLSSKSNWTSAKLANYGGTVTWGVLSQRGTCGSKAEWILDTEGKLYICGSGSMYSYSETSRAPWYNYRSEIQTVFFRDVTSIGAYAFDDCTKLQLVMFSGSAPSFGTNAFRGVICDMWYPSSEYWSSSVCKDYGGTLTWRSITTSGKSGTNARWALDSTGTLVVLGTGSMGNFSSTSQPWYSSMASIKAIVIGDGISNIGNYAFVDASALQSVTMGDGITTIGSYAFWNCKALKTVTISDSVTTLNNYAFRNCTALQSVTIGDSVTSIDSYAFTSCSGLKTITFLGNAPSITSTAFDGVTATAYYPIANSTWTTSKQSNYGGTLTWQAVCTRHQEIVVPAVAATCTTAGATEGSYCSLCNEVLVAQEVIPAKGHFVLNGNNVAVSADSVAADCLKNLYCTVCGGVAKEAAGHRILGTVPVPADPLTITNTSSYPFKLENGTYYSTNTKHDSYSTLRITAKYDCSLTLIYGVSSEEDYDELEILVNGSYKDTISGEVAEKTMSLVLKAGDYVTIYYDKDDSDRSGKDCGWVKLVYDPVMVDGVGDVPAQTGEPDCTSPVVCKYCDTVIKEALGHRVIVPLPEPECPYDVINTSTVPFVLTDGTYYSANHGGGSSSELQIKANKTCTLTLTYGVFSEQTHDKLTILRNGMAEDTISGDVSGKTLTMNLTAGEILTVRYSKDSSVNKDPDQGWVSIAYDKGTLEEIVPADSVEATCSGVICDFCQAVVKEALPHTEVIDAAIAPTCTESGLTEGKHCSVCNDVIIAQETVNALGHTEVTDAGIAATCTESGITEGKHCSVCETVLIPQETVNALGHTEVTDSAVAPTCTESGLTEGKHCSACNEVFVAQETINALGHTEVTDSAVAATCTESGLTEGKHCSVCDEVIVAQETIPAAGHTAVVDAEVSATCTEDGLTEGSHCSVCQEILVAQEKIPAAHVEVVDPAVKATCTVSGLTEGKHCSVCNVVLVAQELIPAGHTEVVDEAVAATCTENGLTEGKHCSVCNEVLTAQETVPAKGHTKVIVQGTEPTCTESGLTEGRHCSVCDKVIVAQETIPATGHTEVVDPEVSATCTKDGLTEGTHCSVCREILVAQEKIPAAHVEVVDPAVQATCTASGLTEGKHCSVCNVVLVAQELIPAGHTVENGICIKCESYGTCGDDLTWEFDVESGKLIISGTGAMETYAFDTSLWDSLRDDIVSISITDGVTSISTSAFEKCTELTEVTMANSVTELGAAIFNECTKLTKVTISNSVKVIPNAMFRDCKALESILIPKGITTIDNSAFAGCIALSEIIFPASVQELFPYAFWQCSNLKKVTFEGDAPVIWEGDPYQYGSFAECVLTAYYPANNPTWTKDVLQNYGGTITWVPYGTPEKPIFPKTGTVTTSLNVRSAPSTNASIVKTLDAGTTVEILRTEMTNGNVWGLIDSGWIMMNYVDLGNGSGSMDNTCGTNLIWSFDENTGILTISGTGPMSDFTMSAETGVQYGAKPADSPWLEIEDQILEIEVKEGVTTIGTGAFANFDNLTKVSLPDSLTGIGDHAFNTDTSLTQLQIPDGVTYLGDYALAVCVNLTSVNIPEGITRIGNSTFDQCLALDVIRVPSGVTEVGDKAFAYCTDADLIVFTGNAPAFAENAFYNTTTSVQYPGGNATWTSDVFQNYGGNIAWITNQVGYAVTFDPAGGEIMEPVVGEYIPGTVTPLPENVIRSGYIFLGWYEGDTKVTEIPADATGDKVFIAKWQEKETVQIDTSVQIFAYDGKGKEFILKDLEGNLLPVASGTDWIVPCSYTSILSPFGERTHPDNVGASTYHLGIDLDTGTDWPVVAARAGIVYTNYGSASGNCVTIDHQDGFKSIYMHLNGFAVSNGTYVSAGQLIGYTGSTGVSTGDHLHFGISLNDVYVDPAKYVNLDGDDVKFFIDYSYSGAALNANGLPYEPGTYGIQIMRAETATQKAVDLVIKPAIEIVSLSGSCGSNLRWEFNPDTGVLTISGSGGMYNYSEKKAAPWNAYRDQIREICFDSISMPIGNYAFVNCTGLTSVTIPDGVYRIGNNAFFGCNNLKTITFTADAPSMEENAFQSLSATACYPAGWGWNESYLEDYGGDITWVETGVDAKQLVVWQPEMMAVGMTTHIGVDIRPWNALADCAFSVSDPSVVEIVSANLRSLDIRAVAAGTVTLTVTEQKSGLSYSGEITVVEPQPISVPCSMEMTVPEGNSYRYLSVTPEVDGTYLFSITSDLERITESDIIGYGDGILLYATDTDVDVTYGSDGENQTISAYLNAGTTYIIGLPFLMSAYEQTAQFTAEDISDGPVRTFLHFYQDQEEITFMPGADEMVYLSVNYNGIGDLTWSCSDPSVLEIMESYEESNECRFRAVGEGTATITVSDGVLSDSIAITTKMVECLELYLPVTEIQEKEYFYKQFAFIAPEDGRYAFSAAAEGGIPTIGFNSWSSEANILFSYGENSCSSFRDMKAGEICEFDVYGFISSCTVRVSKATAKPLSLKVITTNRSGDSITVGASFTPGNACERIVKWEIDNRDIASEVNNPDRFSNDRNEMTYVTFGAGTFTVTATSESGLKAKLTVAVQENLCQDGHTYGEWTPLQDLDGNETGRERRTCIHCSEYQERSTPPLDETVPNRVIMDSADLAGQSTVWIDGAEYTLQKHGDKCYVDLPDGNARTLVTYTYSKNSQTRYPIGMRVWMLANEEGIYRVTRQEAFDDILQYSGMSIRVTGKKGIRMITSIEKNKKNALVSGGLEGYTLKEYGTVVAWASKLTDGNPLTLGQSYAMSNYAYKKGVADPVFAYSGDLMQYTNVLVNFSDEQCKNELALRPYMILEDENGETLTVYGGILYRSIGYIAYQNRNVFEPGTEEYTYIWDIIQYVYGDVYDDEFEQAWTPPSM